MSEERVGDTKIACRNVWKVYGEAPERFFEGGRGAVDDPAALCTEIRASGHICAAADVSFEVGVGEVFVIMGLSGSGKSTVVRCLSRLVEPTAGEVLLDGADLLRASKSELTEIRRKKLGMVFQNFGLLPHLTVLENVAFPLRVQGVAETERRARAQEMVELVGLGGREGAYPRQLSGGQQQRVGIARSLAVEPDLWLLDEPFSALDPLIRRQMQDEFMRLQTLLHKTIVFITHDFLEAIRVGDRVAVMKDGQVVQIGSPAEIVLHPADGYVAEFTQDVPRVRVITARAVMEPPLEDAARSAAVDADTVLEDILPRFGNGEESVAVTDAEGGVIGRITPQRIVAALAASEPRAA